MRRLVTGTILAALTVAFATAGCDALVGTVPAFTCTPGIKNVCPVGQVCGKDETCVDACPDTPCPSGSSCNTATHLCGSSVDAGPEEDADEDTTVVDAPTDQGDTAPKDSPNAGDVGAPCTGVASCMAGLFCADSSVLTAAVTNLSGTICTKPCCASEDCPRDYACFAPGTGGSYCVKASNLPRNVAAGAGKGGSACNVPADCRSGVCLDENTTGTLRCADSCCADGACPGGGICGIVTVETHVARACTEPVVGGNSAGQFCGVPSDCSNGNCIDGSCSKICCGKSTCSANLACQAVEVQSAVKEYFPGCVSGTLGTGQLGDPCPAGHSDCASGFCEPGAATCIETCCTDVDCASHPGLTACRPDPNPNFHFLICSKP